MKEEQIWRAVREIEQARVPESVNHWPAIRQRISKRNTLLMRMQPATRLGWAMLAAIVLLAIGTGAYAIGTLMNQATNMEAGLQYIEQAKLYHEVNQSQTVDGVTVTLERVYADANRVVIGTTVKGLAHLPDGRNISHSAKLELSDDEGHALPQIGGVGQGTPPYTQASEQAVSMLESFDTSAVPGNPLTLHLHLVADVNTDILPTVVPDCPVGKDCGGPVDPPIKTTGPFSFDLIVPVIPGKVVKVGQTVEKSGAVLTLDRIIITPSQTRVVICVKPPDQEHDRWAPDGDLNPGTVRTTWVGRFSGYPGTPPQNGCYSWQENGFYGDQHGEWTYTVNKLYGQVDWHPEKKKVLTGPWVFRFRMP